MSNPHLSDPSLRPFLTPTFSAIDYLNTTLPSLGSGLTTNTTPTTTTTKAPTPSSTTLSTQASQTQSHISTLNAQQSRLSTTLTELTDEILRTSSRLAYEVELLRGEAVGLADALSRKGVLSEAIETVVPGGGGGISTSPPAPSEQSQGQPETEAEGAAAVSNANEPAALPKLRTLHAVRNQLQAVIQTFNTALGFAMPPSMLTTTTTTVSSIVSIGSPAADPDAERKGHAALAKLKGEVVDLLRAGDLRGARGRVQELRGVCAVWKGTGEERARGRWVEGLERLVEATEEEEERERREQKGGRKLVRREESDGGRRGRQTPMMNEKAVTQTGNGGGGFLRRLRDEIYLD